MNIFTWLNEKAVEIMSIMIGILLLIIISLWFWSLHINEQLKTCSDRNALLSFSNNSLKISIDQQNAAIDALRENELSLKAKADAAIALAKKASETHKRSANAIKGYRGSGDQCKDADALLSSYVKVAI